MNLTDDEIERIAERVADKLTQRFVELNALLKPVSNKPVLTISEAMNVTGHTVPGSFYKWARGTNLKPCGRGRYLAEHVNHALRVAAVSKRARK